MLKVSAFYLEKQKSFIPKKKGRSQYQNKKALITDLIFSDGFDLHTVVRLRFEFHVPHQILYTNLALNRG